MTSIVQHIAAFIWATVIVGVMLFIALEVADRHSDNATALGEAWSASPAP